MPGVLYRKHETNEYAWLQANILVGLPEHLLSSVKRHKLSWSGHVCRHDTLVGVAEEDR